ncbi:MAG TPA: phosphatidylserine decarboxylase family protein [Desulfobulbus sp.]|nr:phosphatidylserine decarboxylase family protein [Desulfobulbus sp.]
MKKQHLPLAREGYPFIFFCAFAALLCALLGLTAATFIGLLLTTFVTWFFRDPSRVIPDDPAAIVCPADGRVIIIKEMDDDRFLKGRVLKISIFMNIFNVHVNRIPCLGRVERILFKPGKFYSADNEKAALHNEYCAVTLATPSGIRYCVVQVAGLIARRIVCRAEPGDTIAAGRRYGLIRFGSRVDLYLPPDTKVEVQLRQKVRSGETILAHLSPDK